jgi:hypothetical protein
MKSSVCLYMRCALRVYLYVNLNLIKKTILYIKDEQSSQRYACDMPAIETENPNIDIDFLSE